MITINTSQNYTFIDVVEKLTEIRDYFKCFEGKTFVQDPQKIVYATRVTKPEATFNDEYSFYVGLHNSNPLHTLRGTMFLIAADDLTADWQLQLNEDHKLKNKINIHKT